MILFDEIENDLFEGPAQLRVPRRIVHLAKTRSGDGQVNSSGWHWHRNLRNRTKKSCNNLFKILDMMLKNIIELTDHCGHEIITSLVVLGNL